MLKVLNGKLIWALAFAAGLAFQNAYAQDASGEGVTDEELKQYAVVMNKIDSLGDQVKTTYNDLVKSHELMDGGRNYVKLEETKEDSLKIADLGLAPEVLAAYQELKNAYDSLQSDYKEEYTRMVKEDLGVSLYNKVRGQLKSDKELQAKYNEMLAGFKAGDSGEEGTDDGGSD